MPTEEQKLTVIRQVRGEEFARKASRESWAYRDTCFKLAAQAALEAATARNDAAAAVGTAVESFRQDAAQVDTRGLYRADYRSPPDARPVYQRPTVRADAIASDGQSCSAAAQAANRARRFGEFDAVRERSMSMSAEDARKANAARRNAAA